MAKAADDSSAAKDAVKKSGVGKAAPAKSGAPGATGAGVIKKKLTAAEARKKLKGKSAPDGSKVAAAAGDGGGDGPAAGKKPVPNLDLRKDLSRQAGLKKEGEPDAAETAPARPRQDPNQAIHTTNRDQRETRKVLVLLSLGALVAVGVIGLVIFLQLRDPAAGGKAALLKLEMEHYRQVLAGHPTVPPGPGGKVGAGQAMTALSGLLEAKYKAAQPDPKAVAGAADNPELYSLDLARQFLDPYGQPVRIGLVEGKIVIRSFGADGIDQTGDQSATAQGDDQVVSE